MASAWDPAVLGYPMFDAPWLALALVPLLYLSLMLAIAAHEAGHAAAVGVVRGRLLSVGVGSGKVLASFTLKRTTFTVGTWPNRGLTLYLLDGLEHWRLRTAPILLAGATTNIVVGVTLYAVATTRPVSIVSWVVAWIAVTQFWIGITNLVPWRTPDMASDGLSLGTMVFRHRPWLLSSLALHAILASAIWDQQTSCVTSDGRAYLDRLMALEPSLSETTTLLTPAGRIGLAYALLTQHRYGEALRMLPAETVEIPGMPALAGLRDNYFAVATMSIIEAEGGSSAAHARADEIPAVRRALLRTGQHHRGGAPHAISLGMFALVEGHLVRASCVLDGTAADSGVPHVTAMRLCTRAGLARALGDDARAAELLATARQLSPGCPRPDAVEGCQWAAP